MATQQGGKAPQGRPGVKSAELVEEQPQAKGIQITSKSLADQCNVEIQNIQEYETDSIHAETATKWLTSSGYKLSTSQEKDDDGMEQSFIHLDKDVENNHVRVSFIPWEEDEDAEKDDEAQDMQQAEGEDGQDPNTQPSEDEIQSTQAVTIRISMKDASGAAKGEIRMKGFAGVDHRLYVRELDAKKEGAANSSHSTYLSELSGDLQDKVYDFLDNLGVDDNMAFFIKQEVIRDRSRSDIKFLNTFRELLKWARNPFVRVIE